MFVEQLEHRKLFDINIVGGPGHAGAVIDVRDSQGTVIGALRVDFYASGYFGETPGTTDQSCGNVIGGIQGRMAYNYNPRPFRNTGGSVRVPGNAEDDARTLDLINQMGGPSLAAMQQDPGQPLDNRVNVQGDFDYYYLTSRNCFSFCGALINAEKNKDMYSGVLPITYDALTRVLNRVSDAGDYRFSKDTSYYGTLKPSVRMQPDELK